MNRPRGFCPACSAAVEFYNDGIGGNHDWRCGNCFHGYTHAQLDKFEKLQLELNEHDAARQQILYDALR